MKLHQNQLCATHGRPAFVVGMVLFFVIVSSLASAEVDFNGLDDRLEANVRALSPLSTTSCDSAKWRVDRLFRDADKNIVAAMQALGYTSPALPSLSAGMMIAGTRVLKYVWAIRCLCKRPI